MFFHYLEKIFISTLFFYSFKYQNKIVTSPFSILFPMKTNSYTIYNASAGSGKTFTLVKSFLKIILENPNPDAFKQLLAITFTNKAVSEMKERIIRMLLIFSDPNKALSDTMFLQIAQELNKSKNDLIAHSQKVLQHILHNYAALSVTTIDGFNHRLIRSFAFDLRLNPNFEVFMDTDDLLQQAVDNLLSKTGENQELTKIITDFSRDKINDDKSWDITSELIKVARLLTIENHFPYLKTLENKTFSDFEYLKRILKNHIKEKQKSIKNNVDFFFQITDNQGLTSDCFSRGSVYNFFKRIKDNPKETPEIPKTKWVEEIETENLYPKTLLKKSPDKAAILDEFHGAICLYFRNIEDDSYQLKFYKNLLQNLIPLQVLSNIQKEVENIKNEENILPISEFNNIIHQTIIGQPTPFIYEKMGQRYRHYFIDEFQDTSALQWGNMLPLISDALQSQNHSGQSGTLLLVGDAKQSIYRWRGGKAEQFMDLYLNENNPFFVEPKVENLDKNFRSYKEIIGFNNDFFEYISQENDLFSTNLYKNLYQKASQNTHTHTKEGGYISIEFLEVQSGHQTQNEDDEEENQTKNEQYIEAVLNAVDDALKCGFRQEDICILTRNNKEGIVLAQALTENGYKIISPEALLLKNIPEIRFLINIIKLSLQKDKNTFLELLLLYAEIKKITDIHGFINRFIHNPIEDFFVEEGFSLKKFHQYSFYEGVAYAVEHFALAKISDAYLSHFLNLIFDFKNTKKGGIADFLTFWEEKKDKLSISAPSGIDAINVMTIHKSKGLEFPVVIYAFVNDELSKKKNNNLWIEVSEEEFGSFKYLWVDNFAGLEKVRPNETTQAKEQELLDSLNVMYVAMTRPEAHLYIISEVKLTKKQDDEKAIKNYSDVLKSFLKYKNSWSDDQLLYEFGTKITPTKKEKTPTQYIEFVQRKENSSYKIVTRQGMLWDTNAQNAIEKGTILHQLLAQIYTQNDILPSLENAYELGIITLEQKPILEKQLFEIVSHTKLKPYFSDDYIIYNETEFINSEGFYERPDRIALDTTSKEATIIDYKTGNFYKKYETQLQKYANTLERIGWKVEKAFLVFINEEVTLQEIVL